MADWYFRNQSSQGGQGGLKACPGCRNLVRSNQDFCPYCARRLKPEGGVRGAVRKFLSSPEAATRLLMGIMVAGFLLQILADLALPSQYRSKGGGGLFFLLAPEFITSVRMGSNFHPFVEAFGQYWRFVSYCFLHFGIIHIAFNAYAFWDLGRLAERMWGAKQVFATFILTGIAGGAASFMWGMLRMQPANSAGASGAICGVLGLFLGTYYRNRHHIGEFLGTQLIRWAVYIVIFGMILRADNGAHIGGMVAGGIMGYFLPPANRTRTPARDEKIWNAAAWLSLVLLIASLGCAVYFFAQGPEYVTSLLRQIR